MKPIYLLLNEEPVGPLTLDEIRARLKAQEIHSGTLWTEEGGVEWKPLFELPGLLPAAVKRTAEPAFPLGWVLGIGLATLVLVIGAASIDGFASFGGALVLLVFGVVLYFIPAMIAANRNHPNAVAISALNLVAGWTFVGWVVALVWSLTESKR